MEVWGTQVASCPRYNSWGAVPVRLTRALDYRREGGRIDGRPFKVLLFHRVPVADVSALGTSPLIFLTFRRREELPTRSWVAPGWC